MAVALGTFNQLAAVYVYSPQPAIANVHMNWLGRKISFKSAYSSVVCLSGRALANSRIVFFERDYGVVKSNCAQMLVTANARVKGALGMSCRQGGFPPRYEKGPGRRLSNDSGSSASNPYSKRSVRNPCRDAAQ